MKHLKFLKKTIVGILFIFTLSSCDKNEILIQSDSNLEYLKCNAVNQYEISEEEALADLSKFLNDESTNDSRASDNRIVRAISSVSLSDYFGNESRNSMGDVDCDKLIYIADFENNQGYAVLAADRRISKPIIGIIDSVAPDPNKPRIEPKPVALRDWDWDILGLTRPVYDGYPTDGPGFFTDPKYQNEVFINPNTVNLYDDDAKDTLVGTYFFDEDEISRAENNDPSFDIKTFTIGLCVSYAANEVVCYGLKNPDLRSTDSLDIRIPGVDYTVTYKIIDTSPWVNLNNPTKYLSKYRAWYQTGEFNDQYPYRHRYLIFGHCRKAPAGCFPLALAKIMAHFKKPDNLILNNTNINLSDVHEGITYDPANFKALQTLLFGISEDCDALYFYKGTFTFPWKISSLMEEKGYINVKRRDYSFSRVKKMIDSGCPVIMYGMPNINIAKSHAWNIDGYKIKARTITKARYEGTTKTKTFTVGDTCRMVHCDFGWGGTANGFYVSDIFNSMDENVELDINYTDFKPFKYNTLLRLITYDRP